MRILYAHSLPNDTHPAAGMVRRVAGELETLGHEVRIHRNEPQTDSQNATSCAKPSFAKRIGWFAKAISRNRPAIERCTQVIREFEPKIVLGRQDAYCFALPLACRRFGVPFVTYADAPVAYESRHFGLAGRWHPPRLVEAIEKWGLRHSSAAVTISNPAAHLLRSYRTGVPVVVAPNGVDVERFRPRTLLEQSQTRTELGIATPLVAGFVGSFQSFHGLPLLGALIRDSVRRSDLTWLLVGDGPGRAGLERELAGHPRVHFLGRQPADRVPELIGCLDLMVVPHQRTVPYFYFCPLKVLEAMAAGVACLASPQGDVPLLLDRGAAGELVASEAVSDWLARLMDLLNDAPRRMALAKAARERVEAGYTWAHTARRVEAVLSRVVRSQAATSRAGAAT